MKNDFPFYQPIEISLIAQKRPRDVLTGYWDIHRTLNLIPFHVPFRSNVLPRIHPFYSSIQHPSDVFRIKNWDKNRTFSQIKLASICFHSYKKNKKGMVKLLLILFFYNHGTHKYKRAKYTIQRYLAWIWGNSHYLNLR
jgi:hypothetical protein